MAGGFGTLVVACGLHKGVGRLTERRHLEPDPLPVPFDTRMIDSQA